MVLMYTKHIYKIHSDGALKSLMFL